MRRGRSAERPPTRSAPIVTDPAGRALQVFATSGSFLPGGGVLDHVQVIRPESLQNLHSLVIAFFVGQDELFARYARREQGIVDTGLLDGRIHISLPALGGAD